MLLSLEPAYLLLEESHKAAIKVSKHSWIDVRWQKAWE